MASVSSRHVGGANLFMSRVKTLPTLCSLRYYTNLQPFLCIAPFGLGELKMNMARVPSSVVGFTKTGLLLLAIAITGCGPSSRGGDRNNPGGISPDATAQPTAPDADTGPCVPQPETTATVCGDGRDNDCDGIIDCGDPECSGIGSCPICGTVQRPLGMPLPLPDGDGTSYETKLNFTGFGPNQTVASASDLQYVCAKMEHSWIRDLQIDLITPPNAQGVSTTIELNKMLGQTGSEVYLGEPIDTDTDNPVPGVGYRYCWSMNASKPPMLEYANANPVPFTQVLTLPASSYKPVTPFANLIGAKLNGDWTLKVTDLWGVDNGFIFEWTIAFDPTILTECPPPVE
jgi:hypothetical protein